VSATGHEDHDDVVATLQVVHVRADLFDHAGRLVTQCHRHGPRTVAVDDRQVGVTKARRAHADQHLPRPRRRQLDSANGKGTAVGVRRGRAHALKDVLYSRYAVKHVDKSIAAIKDTNTVSEGSRYR